MTVARRVLVVLLAVVLVACSGGGGGSGPLEWRDLDLVVPSGWQVLEQRGDLLVLASRDLRTADTTATPSLPQDPDVNEAVRVQFTTDPTNPDAWRGLVEAEGGEIESDQRIQVGGVPATAITFTWATNDVPTREQVVIVPSRELVILLQPVPVQGQRTGPEVYLRHVDEFQAILDSLAFGAPESA